MLKGRGEKDNYPHSPFLTLASHFYVVSANDRKIYKDTARMCPTGLVFEIKIYGFSKATDETLALDKIEDTIQTKGILYNTLNTLVMKQEIMHAL